MVAFTLLVPQLALASQGEWYWKTGGGYRFSSTSEGLLHAGELRFGLGMFPSDFTVAELNTFYNAGYYGGLHHMLGAEASFRLLIDAFEWVPSIGPVLGISGIVQADGDPTMTGWLGAEFCLDYRGQRTHAFGGCVSISIVPFDREYQSMFLIDFLYLSFF